MEFGTGVMKKNLLKTGMVLLFLLSSTSAWAAAISYIGGTGSTTWANTGNWSGGIAPTIADQVTIDIAGTITFTDGPVFNTLTIGGTNAPTVNFSSGQTITVGGASQNITATSGATLNLGGATFSGLSGATLAVNANSFLLTGGTAINSGIGTYQFNLSSSVQFDGVGSETIPVSNYGFLTIAGANTRPAGTSEIIISRDLTITSGTFNGGTTTTDGATWTIKKDLIFNGGTFNPDQSLIIMDAGYYENVTGFGNAQVQANANISFYNFENNYSLSASDDVEFRNTHAANDVVFSILNNFNQTGSSDNILSSAGTGTSSLSYTAATLTYSTTHVVGEEWPVTSGPETVSINTSGTITYNRISSVSVNNILLQAGGTFLLNNASATVTVNTQLTKTNGTFTVSAGALAYGGSAKILYNGTTAQFVGNEWTSSLTIPNIEIQNSNAITISDNGSTVASSDRSAGNITLSTGELKHAGTLNVTGNVTASTGSYGTTDSGTLNATGATSSVVASGNLTLHNLTISSSGGFLNGITINNQLTVNSSGTVTLNGTISLANNATITVTAGTLDLNGQTLNKGTGVALNVTGTVNTGGTSLSGLTISAASGTIVFDGTAAQETLPTGIIIGTLELNNASGGAATSAGTLTVGSSLVLTSGKLITSSENILRLASAATVSGTPSSSNMVVGPLQKAFASGVVSFLYPVGYVSSYRPATFDYLSNDVATSIIQIEAVSGDPGGTKPTGINSIATSHHYVVKEIGTAGTFTYNFTGTYTGTGFTPESRNQLIVQNGIDPDPLYSYPNTIAQTVNTTAKTVKINDALSALPSDDGKIAFGSIGVQITWDGGLSGTGTNWSVAANWVGDVVPQTGDDVLFDHSGLAAAYSVTYDGGTTKNEFSSITIAPGGGNNITLTLSRSTTLTLTSSSNALVVGSNGKLTFSGTTVSMGAGFDNTRTDFQAGSTVEYTTGSVNVDDYNDLIINGASGIAGSGTLTVNGNLTKSSSTGFTTSEVVSVTGSYTNTLGDANYNGGLTVNGTPFTVTSGVVGGTLNIKSATTTVNGGSFSGTAIFNGAAAQTLNGSVSAAFSSFTIDNAAGLTLNTTAQANGTIIFTNGLITTTAANLLTFGSGATVGVGNDNSYVNGPLARINAIGSAVLYPIGKSSYRPVTTNLTGSTPTVRFEVFDSSPNQSYEAQIIRISIVRYWRGQVTSGSISGGNVTLHYGPDDGVSNFDQSGDVVVARSSDNSTDTYKSLGGEASGTSGTGSVTSNTGVGSSLNYFTLGTVTGDNSLPVELSSFEAVSAFNQVALTWNTQSELENLGFNVYRARTAEPEIWKLLNETMIPGQGTYTHATDYEYVDRSVVAGEAYLYKLESVSVSGLRVDERTIEVAVPVPDQYALFKNYPNPFNPTTNIRFQLPDAQNVKLAVYDIRGSLVKTVVNNQAFPAGEHTVTWDATDNNGSRVASGMYIYRFEAGKFSKIDKMILLK